MAHQLKLAHITAAHVPASEGEEAYVAIYGLTKDGLAFEYVGDGWEPLDMTQLPPPAVAAAEDDEEGDEEEPE